MPQDAWKSEEPPHYEEACNLETSGYNPSTRDAWVPSEHPESTPAKTSPAMTSIYSLSPIPSVKSPCINGYEALSQAILEPERESSVSVPGSSCSTLETVLPTPKSFGHSETATMPSPTHFSAYPLKPAHEHEGHKRNLSRPMPIMMVKEPIGELSFARGTIIVKDSKGIEFALQCSQVEITPDTSSEKRGMMGYRIEGTALMNVNSPAGGLFQYEVPTSASTQGSQEASRNMLVVQSPPDPSTGFSLGGDKMQHSHCWPWDRNSS